jgi:hypothetical protein
MHGLTLFVFTWFVASGPIALALGRFIQVNRT